MAYEDRYTEHNVYWLTNRSELGQRMAYRDGSVIGNSPSATCFRDKVHAEEDTAYWQSMKGAIEEDRWFWNTRLSPSASDLSPSRTYTVHLEEVCEYGQAVVRVHLKGYTSLAHNTRIYVNGRKVDDRHWSGQRTFTHEAVIDSSWLESGRNQVEIRTIDTDAVVDQILVNWINIEHWRDFEAEKNALAFSTLQVDSQTFTIEKFDDPEIFLLDIRNPAMPIHVSGGTILPDGDRFHLHVSNTESRASQMIVASTTGTLTPDYMHGVMHSNWKSQSNGADYIIITHESFIESANRLASHRVSQGLRTVVVPIHQLYDEFNHGLWGPNAIRNFLKHAYERWQPPAPTYVLLLGDANQDFKDDKRTGTPNYVPTQVIASSLFGEVSSDNWFVTIRGSDLLPEMFIGRLSVHSAAQANAIVDKIVQYEKQPSDTNWNKTVLMVSDDESRFHSISDNLTKNFPYYYAIVRQQVAAQINSGASLINYLGHGEYFGWGVRGNSGDYIFHKDDISQLTNRDRLSFIAVGNCLNGFFAGPQDKSALGEELIRKANAGAIGVWAPTGYGYPTGHEILLDNLYEAIFTDDHTTFGAATTYAKLETYAHSSFWGELIHTYVLFGDPATKFSIPNNFPYVTEISPTNGFQDVALDQAIQVTFNKPVSISSVALTIEPQQNLGLTNTWNADQTVVTFNHTGFTHDTTYVIDISGADADGNAIGPGLTPKPWRFTSTADDFGPSATVTVSKANHGNALETSPIIISFDQPVRPESLSRSKFQV